MHTSCTQDFVVAEKKVSIFEVENFMHCCRQDCAPCCTFITMYFMVLIQSQCQQLACILLFIEEA